MPPRLTRQDWERIRRYTDKPKYVRTPDDLLPDSGDPEEMVEETDSGHDSVDET